MKRILFFILLLVTSRVFSQGVILKGKILSNAQDFSISLIKNGNLMYSSKSKEDGSFLLRVDKGIYTIEVRHILYNTYKSNIDIYSDTTLRSIEMKEHTHIIDEVVVNKRKNLIERKIDKTIINIDNSIFSGSVLEVFKISPGVNFNYNSISINGNSGTIVMINNKELPLQGESLITYLNSINTSQIERVEIISKPSAQYSASTMGGIINIVMKKPIKDGLIANLFSNYKIYENYTYMNSINSTYKNLKSLVSFNYTYNKEKNEEYLSFDRTINNNTQYNTRTNRMNNLNSHVLNIEYMYEIDSLQDIGVNYMYRKSNNGGYFYSNSHFLDNNKIDSTVGEFPRNISSSQQMINLDYNKKTDSQGSKYSITSDLLLQATNNTNSSINNSLKNVEEFKNLTHSNLNLFSIEVNRVRNIDDFTLIYGIKNSNIFAGNNAEFLVFAENYWQNDKSKSYIYNYRESNFAFFVNSTGKIGKMEYQLGLRSERSITSALYNHTQSLNKKNIDFFPTVIVKGDLNPSLNVSLSYNRKIQRPSFSILNPYEFNVDNYLIGRGNPGLLPYYFSAIHNSYLIKNKYEITLFFEQSNKYSSSIITPSDTDSLISISTWKNILRYNNTGININFPLNVSPWWKTSNNIILRNNKILDEDLSLNQNTISFTTNHNFHMSKKSTCNLYSYFSSSRINGNMKLNPILYIDLSFSTKLLKNENLNFTIGVNDIFNGNQINADIYSTHNSYFAKMIQTRQSRRVFIGLNFTFAKGKSITKKAIKSSSGDEQKRL